MTLRSIARSVAVAASLVAAVAAQQTATYTFSNGNPGPLTPITGGSVLALGAFDDSFFNNVPVGFDFPFGGAATGSGWTSVIGVSTNGWIKCSNVAGSATVYSAISSTAQGRVVAAYGRDLQGGSPSAEVRVETIGVAPNRVCVVQWSGVRPYTSTAPVPASINMDLQFQARLYETTGVIELVYGNCVLSTPGTTTTTGQVGIKGNAVSPVTDFKNCASTSTTFSWATPNNAGTVSSTHYMGTAVGKSPDNGRTYTYTPAAFPPAGLSVTSAVSQNLYYITGMPIITASVTTAPASAVISNLALTINLTSIGGNAAQPMLDDGVFPDAVLNDGTFTYQPTLYSATPVAYSFPITATATGATNGAGSAAVSIYTLANDVPMGSILVARGVNGPFSNVDAVAGNQPGFNTPCGVGGNIGGKDVFFVYTPTCTGTASFSTCGGDNINQPGELSDSQLVVYDSSLVLLGCNDDFEPIAALCGANGYQSRVNNIAVTAGAWYLIRVCGYSSAVGTFNLTIDESSAVSTQFGVSCGDYPLVLNGTPPILGQLGTLSVTNARPASAGFLAYSIPTMVISQIGACPFYLDIGSAAIFTTFIPDAFGMWSLTAPLPNDPNIACLTASMQAFTFANGGMDSSNGLALTFGY